MVALMTAMPIARAHAVQVDTQGMTRVDVPVASQQAPVAAVPEPGVDPVLDARVKSVATRLRCPVCQGESIQDSPAELATQMKRLVREQLHEGRSEQQVLDYFLAKYGDWILLEPRAEGFNLLVYWLPVLFLVLGAGVVLMLVRRWTRPIAPIGVGDGGAATAALSDDSVGAP